MDRKHALDGLRGYAALAVTFYHGILGMNPALAERVLPVPIHRLTTLNDVLAKLCLIVFNGEVAVVLFFIISGAVLIDSLDRAAPGGYAKVVGLFVVKRVLRIYPCLVVSLVLFYGVFALLAHQAPGMFNRFDPQALIENITLARPVINGATWTIQVEMLVVPFILLAHAASRFLGPGAYLLFLWYGLSVCDNPALAVGPGFFSVQLFQFGFGFLIASIGRDSVFSRLGTMGGLGALAVALLARHLVPHGALSGAFVQGAAGALLVGALRHGGAGRLGGLLSSRLSCFFGRISYSYYLLNVMVLNIVLAVLPRVFPVSADDALPFGLLAGGVALLLTLPLAALSERWIERPSIQAGRWLTERLGRRFPRFNGAGDHAKPVGQDQPLT